jgi:hypothetical protein
VGLWLGIAFGIAFVTGLGPTRVLPTGVRPPVMIGALCTLTLLAVSARVLLRQGALADNPTVLNRNYPAGLGVALLVVWAAVALVLVVRLRRKAGAAV